jgi:hypothetical protein
VKLGGDRGGRLTAKARAAGRAIQRQQARNRALDLAPTIKELQEAGCTSLRAIAAALEVRGIPAARGGKWTVCRSRGCWRWPPFLFSTQAPPSRHETTQGSQVGADHAPLWENSAPQQRPDPIGPAAARPDRPNHQLRIGFSSQTSAEHFQQRVEFPALRNRSLGPLAVPVLPVSLAWGRAATDRSAVQATASLLRRWAPAGLPLLVPSREGSTLRFALEPTSRLQ